MTICLGKSCSFGLLCVSFINVYQFVRVCASFSFDFESEMWDLLECIPYHCLFFYAYLFPFLSLPFVTMKLFVPILIVNQSSHNIMLFWNKNRFAVGFTVISSV